MTIKLSACLAEEAEYRVEYTGFDIAAECDRATLLQIIKDIETKVDRWSFTLELADHFAKLKAKHDKLFPPLPPIG